MSSGGRVGGWLDHAARQDIKNGPKGKQSSLGKKSTNPDKGLRAEGTMQPLP
jgi:hypothetical protein